ncbi:hypothetical protein ACI6Q2_07870 [Chitinophagaceae bacterium LWZ2-11]
MANKMIMENIFPASEEAKEYFKKKYVKHDEELLQEIMIYLRDMGCSQMQTLFLLVAEADFSFKDANKTILNSKAWNN